MPDASRRLCQGRSRQYSARWPTGAVVIPNTPEVLVTYVEVCAGLSKYHPEGWGFMEYNWRTNAIDSPPDDVFRPSNNGSPLPANLDFNSPIVTNGRLTLFSSVCTEGSLICGAGHVYYASLPATLPALRKPASYRVLPVASDGPTWRPTGITVASYPNAQYRMIETTSIGGTYEVLTATAPAGPWHFETSGTLPGCQSPAASFCHALVGHPELSSSSGLVITYYDVGAGPNGSSGSVGHIVGIRTSYGLAASRPLAAGSAQ
jgi:hypothetical protein